jgi:hypothetical protein
MSRCGHQEGAKPGQEEQSYTLSAWIAYTVCLDDIVSDEAELCPITEPGPSRHFLEIGDARFPLQHRLQCMDAGIPERLRWLETVDGYPRTGGITLGLREIKDHGAIGTVIHCDAVAA